MWTTWGDKDLVTEQAMCDAFTKQQPNIVVHAQTVPDGDKYTAAMASGAPPDLLQTWNAAEVAAWAVSGGVTQLDSYIAAGKMDLSKIDQGGLAAGKLFGKQFGMPMLVYTNTLLFWNKSIFQTGGLDAATPPETWQALTQDATKFNQQQGGAFTRMGFVPSNGQGGLGNIVWSFGGQLYSDDGKQVTPDNPGVVKCAQYMRSQIVQFGGLDAINAFKKGFGSNANDPFYIGQIVTQINGEWLPTFIPKYKPDLQYGVGYMPYDETAPQAKQSGNIGTNLIIIPKDGKHQQESWDVIAFANTPEPNLALAKGLGNTPQVLAAVDMMAQQAATPELKFILQAHKSPNMRSSPINPVSNDYNKALGTAMGDILSGKAEAPSALAQVKQIIQPKLDAIVAKG